MQIASPVWTGIQRWGAWYVALAIEKATGTRTWVVSNGDGIIKDAMGVEAIAALTDMYRFANRR